MGALDVPQELAGLSGLYNTPDPLLRRLRINQPDGRPILDVDKYFKDREVLILYAGGEQGSNNLSGLHKGLTSLALRQLKHCSILYVSTDTDPKAPARVTANVPWLKLTFNDNSDFAPLVVPGSKEAAKIVEIEDVERGEDFVQAGELEVGAEKVALGVEEYQHDYVRPLSRAAVTSLMRSYSTPSLAVYHIPSHSMIARNVNPKAFSAGEIDKNFHTWRNGGSPSIRLADIFKRLQWPLIGLLIALLYQLLILYGGQQYNVIPIWIDKLGWRGNLGSGRVL